jgi:hypothetical protein
MALSLWSRKRDLIYIGFFAIHIPIILCELFTQARRDSSQSPHHPSIPSSSAGHGDERTLFSKLVAIHRAAAMCSHGHIILEYVRID